MRSVGFAVRDPAVDLTHLGRHLSHWEARTPVLASTPLRGQTETAGEVNCNDLRGPFELKVVLPRVLTGSQCFRRLVRRAHCYF
jgi:hypothetical protein